MTSATLEKQPEPTFSFTIGNGEVAFETLKTNKASVAHAWFDSLTQTRVPAGDQLVCKHEGVQISPEKMKEILANSNQI